MLKPGKQARYEFAVPSRSEEFSAQPFTVITANDTLCSLTNAAVIFMKLLQYVSEGGKAETPRDGSRFWCCETFGYLLFDLFTYSLPAVLK